MNINEKLNQDAEKYNLGNGGGGDYFNIEEGNDNVARILTSGEVYATHYLGKGVKSPVCYGAEKGCPIRDEETKMHSSPSSVRYATYVLDRKDGEIKLATLPYSVMKGIGSLQENPDFKFEDFPMVYDVRITYKKEESPANKYKVDAVPKISQITDEERKMFDEKFTEISPEQFVQKMKDKQIKTHQESGIWLSPEKLEAEQKERAENYKKDVEAHNKKAGNETPNTPELKTIEYPTGDINPEDIPF